MGVCNYKGEKIMIPNSKFKSRLKELRLERELTQKQLADVLFTSEDCISAWENGRTEPYIEMICKICRYFDVTCNYLLGIED